uniref:Large ribosomal subunit protein uL10 n=1 Tax=candidate division WOR-3 bacterium TaxID=2052148 RepID=A0A7C4XAN5_UNCW3
MPSPRNKDYLEKTIKLLKDGKAFYFTDFTGITVQKLENLRRELKKNQGNYLVIKNTLGLLALKEMGFDETLLKNTLTGPTGIAIAYDDPIILAKFLKENGEIKIKGGIVEGEFYDAKGVLRFSEIPSKMTLYSHLLGALNVVAGLQNTIEGILRNFIYTLEGIKNKREEA